MSNDPLPDNSSLGLQVPAPSKVSCDDVCCSPQAYIPSHLASFAVVPPTCACCVIALTAPPVCILPYHVPSSIHSTILLPLTIITAGPHCPFFSISTPPLLHLHRIYVYKPLRQAWSK
jgi:hypothetical protein